MLLFIVLIQLFILVVLFLAFFPSAAEAMPVADVKKYPHVLTYEKVKKQRLVYACSFAGFLPIVFLCDLCLPLLG